MADGDNVRPSWRQSEIDVGKDFSDYVPQVSFIDREMVHNNVKGSVRPDFYKSGNSIEVKNYNIRTSKGRYNLVRNIEKQYYQRITHLPSNTNQTVIIDIRGQKISKTDLKNLCDNILKRTHNGIKIVVKEN